MHGIDAAGASRRTVLRALALAAAVAASARGTGNAAEGAAVGIDNFTFSPAELRIRAGTEVRWTNNDDIPHSIYCQGLGLRSHPMDTGQSFAHVFDRPGTFDYICGIHPHMHGRVIVAA